jgi:hypothetical protein
VKSTRNAIAALLSEALDVRTAVHLGVPEPGSVAAAELRAPELPLRAIERVIRCADLWTNIAGDHLRGIGTLVADGTNVFGVFPLTRSALEHATSIAWVMDDEASTRRRAVRAALADIHSEMEMNAAVRRMAGKESDEARSRKARLRELRDEVQQDFGNLELEPEVSIDGETAARPTAIVERFGDRWGDARQYVGMYDYLCATANHPSFSAFEYFDISDPLNPAARISDEVLGKLVRVGLVPYLKSLEYFAGYMGWSSNAVWAYASRAAAVLEEDILRDPSASGLA